MGHSNIHYMGFAEKQDEISFLEAFLKDSLVESYESALGVPGG